MAASRDTVPLFPPSRGGHKHALLRILALFLALLGLLILLALIHSAPIVTLGLVFAVGFSAAVLDERGVIHRAQEYELRAYAFLSSVIVAVLLFSPDSFVPIGYHYPNIGYILVFGWAAAVFLKGRQLHRRTLQGPRRMPMSSTTLANDGDVQVLEIFMHQITEALDVIDGLVPSTINNYIRPSTIWRRERAIIDAFRNANKDQLNRLVASAQIGRLFYKVKDHGPSSGLPSPPPPRGKGEGPDAVATDPSEHLGAFQALPNPNSRTELVELLVKERLPELSIKSRVIILHALQAMRLTAHVNSEKWVRHIFLQTQQEELSLLKTRLDNSGSYYTLHRLLFHDIRDASIREDLLLYFEKEALLQATNERLGTGGSPGMKARVQRMHRPCRKILSDVDDTLMSSGGKFPAGVDERLPRHECYPGVLEFYKQLDLGFHGPADWDHAWPGNLGFLSARPHVYKDLAERKLYERIERMQREKGLHTSAHVLCGSLSTGARFMFNNDMQPLASKKFENFEEYRALYPEFRHVFVGDNGQGDVRAGEMMLDKYGASVESVYVHRVVPTEWTFGYHGAESVRRWKQLGIVFFDTYIDAALHASKPRVGGGAMVGFGNAPTTPINVPPSAQITNAKAYHQKPPPGNLSRNLSRNRLSSSNFGHGESASRSPRRPDLAGNPADDEDELSDWGHHDMDASDSEDSQSRSPPPPPPRPAEAKSAPTLVDDAKGVRAETAAVLRELQRPSPHRRNRSASAFLPGARGDEPARLPTPPGKLLRRESAPGDYSPEARDTPRHLFRAPTMASAVQASRDKDPLMKMSGLRAVCLASIADYRAMMPKFQSIYQLEEQRLLLNRSLTKANKALVDAGLEPVAPLRARCAFRPGTAVSTTLGNGHVVEFRSEDGMYKVELDEWGRREVCRWIEPATRPGRSRSPLRRPPGMARHLSKSQSVDAPVRRRDILTRSFRRPAPLVAARVVEDPIEDPVENPVEDLWDSDTDAPSPPTAPSRFQPLPATPEHGRVDHGPLHPESGAALGTRAGARSSTRPPLPRVASSSSTPSPSKPGSFRVQNSAPNVLDRRGSALAIVGGTEKREYVQGMATPAYGYFQLSQLAPRGELPTPTPTPRQLMSNPLTRPIARTYVRRVVKVATQVFPVGSQVRMSSMSLAREGSGRGMLARVRSYRPRQGIYLLELESWRLSGKAPVLAFCHASQVSAPNLRPPLGELKRSVSTFDRVSQMFSPLLTGITGTASRTKADIRKGVDLAMAFPAGLRVKTKYGVAVVREVRTKTLLLDTPNEIAGQKEVAVKLGKSRRDTSGDAAVNVAMEMDEARGETTLHIKRTDAAAPARATSGDARIVEAAIMAEAGASTSIPGAIPETEPGPGLGDAFAPGNPSPLVALDGNEAGLAPAPSLMLEAAIAAPPLVPLKTSLSDGRTSSSPPPPPPPGLPPGLPPLRMLPSGAPFPEADVGGVGQEVTQLVVEFESWPAIGYLNVSEVTPLPPKPGTPDSSSSSMLSIFGLLSLGSSQKGLGSSGDAAGLRVITESSGNGNGEHGSAASDPYPVAALVGVRAGPRVPLLARVLEYRAEDTMYTLEAGADLGLGFALPPGSRMFAPAASIVAHVPPDLGVGSRLRFALGHMRVMDAGGDRRDAVITGKTNWGATAYIPLASISYPALPAGPGDCVASRLGTLVVTRVRDEPAPCPYEHQRRSRGETVFTVGPEGADGLAYGRPRRRAVTLEMQFSSWTLRDGSHPTVYAPEVNFYPTASILETGAVPSGATPRGSTSAPRPPVLREARPKHAGRGAEREGKDVDAASGFGFGFDFGLTGVFGGETGEAPRECLPLVDPVFRLLGTEEEMRQRDGMTSSNGIMDYLRGFGLF